MIDDRFQIRPIRRADYDQWRPQTQVTNQAGRALYDRVAQHFGFIVYSHELAPPEV